MAQVKSSTPQKRLFSFLGNMDSDYSSESSDSDSDNESSESDESYVAKKKRRTSKTSKKTRRDDEDTSNTANVESLVTSNIFEDSKAAEMLDTERPVEKTTLFNKRMQDLYKSMGRENVDFTRKDVEAKFREARLQFKGRSMRVDYGEDGTARWKLKGVTTPLFHHQLFGAARMRKLEDVQTGPRGGILADEMGFGKTIMMLANIVEGNRRGSKKDITLLVLPSQLVQQWREQVETHCDIKAIGRYVVHAAGSKSLGGNLVREFRKYNLIITTYAEIRDSFKGINSSRTQAIAPNATKKGPFHQINFHRIVLDEAQAIKNNKSNTFLACQALEATHRWAISGTPLQNGATEAYSYLAFLRAPGITTMREFKRDYIIFDDKALARELQKYVIRRTHKDTIFGVRLVTLPAIQCKTIPLELNTAERELYDAIDGKVKQVVAQIKKDIQQAKISGVNSDGVKIRSQALTLILRFKQISTHFVLIAPIICGLLETASIERLITSSLRTQHDINALKSEKLVQRFQLLSKQQGNSQRKNKGKKSETTRAATVAAKWAREDVAMALYSTKTSAIVDQVRNWITADMKEGNADKSGKIIIFTQFREFITVLMQIFKKNQWSCVCMHGGMNTMTRMAAINTWEAEPEIRILLATLGTGGTGLNLTAASRIINVDLWWNSGVEQQAFARIHRIGQKHNTEIIRFVVTNTYDEKLIAIQEKKASEIANAIRGGGSTKGETLDELFDIIDSTSEDHDEEEAPADEDMRSLLLNNDLGSSARQDEDGKSEEGGDEDGEHRYGSLDGSSGDEDDEFDDFNPRQLEDPGDALLDSIMSGNKLFNEDKSKDYAELLSKDLDEYVLKMEAQIVSMDTSEGILKAEADISSKDIDEDIPNAAAEVSSKDISATD